MIQRNAGEAREYKEAGGRYNHQLYEMTRHSAPDGKAGFLNMEARASIVVNTIAACAYYNLTDLWCYKRQYMYTRI